MSQAPGSPNDAQPRQLHRTPHANRQPLAHRLDWRQRALGRKLRVAGAGRLAPRVAEEARRARRQVGGCFHRLGGRASCRSLRRDRVGCESTPAGLTRDVRLAALAGHHRRDRVARALLRGLASGAALAAVPGLHGGGRLLGAGHVDPFDGDGGGAALGAVRFAAGSALLLLSPGLAGGRAGARCHAGDAGLRLSRADALVVWSDPHAGGADERHLRDPPDDPHRGARVLEGYRWKPSRRR